MAREERDEALARRFAGQWRAAPRNHAEVEVPAGVEIAAAWSWRLLLIAAGLAGLLWLLGYFLVLVFPLVVALLACALLSPLVSWLEQVHVRRRIGSLLTVLLAVVVIALLITFVSSQIASSMGDLTDQVVSGVGKVEDWLRTGPLGLSDKDLQNAITQLQNTISNVGGGQLLGQLGEVSTTLGHVGAGIFITLFGTYFFLADGRRIWRWTVRLFPRVARDRVDGSGYVAWRSLTQFVRATVIIAATDAIGIMVVALLLRLPLVFAIGVVVFLGAFVPVVGALVSGSVAVLVALVDKGLVAALLMLLGVLVVQQVESHVLQPFLMGRFVAVHPLGVILAVAAGVLVAGVVGALVAVPLAAAVNAVVVHLAGSPKVQT